MARFVLAGKADCPHFAKAEYLADKCQKCLPDFSIRKIPILPDLWQDWLKRTCENNGWKHDKSPLIWREVSLGCRGILLGGLSDFMEHCHAYYNLSVDMSSEKMMKISEENMVATLDQIREEQEHLRSIHPLNVWICSALSPVCTFLIPHLLLDPKILPQVSLVSLHLLDLDLDQDPDQDLELRGLQMEVEDLAAPKLHQVTVHTKLNEAFSEADLIIFLDNEGSLRDLEIKGKKYKMSAKMVDRYREYGRQIELRARAEVRVLLYGLNHINLKCALILENITSKNKRNFVTVATHVEKQTKVIIAKKLGVNTEDVRDILVWGDVGGSVFIDTHTAGVYNLSRAITSPPAVGLPLSLILELRRWSEAELQDLVGLHVTRRGSTTMCGADAVLTLLKSWDSPGAVSSVGVDCSGLLNLPDGVVLSVPVSFRDGTWSLLPDLDINENLKDKLLQWTQDFIQEKALVLTSQ